MPTTSNPEQKKLKSVHILIFLSLFITFIAYGFYEIIWKAKLNGATLIDNPTALPLTVTIDNELYEIPANQYLKVNLNIGHHKISCKSHQVIDQDLYLDPTEYGVVNPTKAKYVIYNIIYTKKDLKNKFKAYQVEGKKIYSLLGEPEVITDLFIPDRTLGKGNIDKIEPTYESYNRVNQDYSYLTKIFRLDDFFKFYDKHNN